MKSRFRIILAALMLVAGPVWADAYQQNRAIVPPNKLLRSAGGVDMVSGKYAQDDLDLAPASSTSKRLRLSRVMPAGAPGHANVFGDVTSSLDIYITERKFDSTAGDPNYPGNDYRMGVRVGGLTSSFDALQRLGGDNAGLVLTSNESYEVLSNSSGLSSSSSQYTYTAQDGTIIHFRPIGGGDCSSQERCAFTDYLIEPNGTRLNFSYIANPSGAFGGVVLAGVTSSDGFQINFEQSVVGGQSVITKACLFNMASQNVAPTAGCSLSTLGTVVYGYTVFGGRVFLTAVTDRSGAVWTVNLGTDANGNTTKAYVKPGQSAPWMINTIYPRMNAELISEDLVYSQQFATGESYSYTHLTAIFGNGVTSPVAGGTYLDAAGKKVSILYATPTQPYLPPGSGPPGFPQGGNGSGPLITYKQLTPGPVTVTDQLGRTTTYDYCDRANPTGCLVTVKQSVTYPSGLRTEFYYDGPGRISDLKDYDPNGLLPIRVTHYDHQCPAMVCYDEATAVIDPNGFETDYTYSTDHGGVLTESAPADSHGIRAVKRYAYAQRYAWISNGSGFAHAGSPIWLLTEMRTCRTSATVSGGCAAGIADEVVTSYDYGPDTGLVGNNLFLRGVAVTADGQTLRTCYGYDVRGNQISQTSPRANLAVCP